jgi:hypothetical protein
VLLCLGRGDKIKMKGSRWIQRAKYFGFILLVTVCYESSVRAVVSVDVVGIDLPSLIDQAAHFSTRFAVDIARPISPANAGSRSKSGLVGKWPYSVRIPTAVSMSFHDSTPLFAVAHYPQRKSPRLFVAKMNSA